MALDPTHQSKCILNDVHSQLNATAVASVERPFDLAGLRAVARRAAAEGRVVSVAGGRHAMGGQQFAKDSIHIDMTGLSRVLDLDSARGLLRIEAGACWPAIIEATHRMECPDGGVWSIRQKQTGVDEVTLGGSISVNAHGRGLLMQPLGGDIETLEIVNAAGDLVTCSREENPELFSLVVGGYGLFGIIYSATLRLSPRQRVERLVELIDLDEAVKVVFLRADEGCLYGDFQFAIDPTDPGFLWRGVFACYKPAESRADMKDGGSDLSPDAWLELIKLAHEDKRRAFGLYADHYLATGGRQYWSDAMQLSTYIPSYAEYLESKRADQGAPSAPRETLVIGEHYVPRDRLLDFMRRARGILAETGTEVIYGTIRAILQDTVSFLPWAKEDSACVIFNLRTAHTPEGIRRTGETFRLLIDAALDRGGSFFLTYHRHATVGQIARGYPRFREWLALKRLHDPSGLFASDWHSHYREAFEREGGGE